MRLFDFTPTIMKFVLPLVFFTAVTTLFATPWARHQADKLRLQAENDSSLKQYSAGRFSEFSKGNRIIFFERTEKESMKLGLVFVKIQMGANRETVILGGNGEISFINETRGRTNFIIVGVKSNKRMPDVLRITSSLSF